MGVVGADVVLDQQPVPVAGGRGVQARMVELQRAGAVQAAHEGRHARVVPAVRRQLPGAGAVDRFGREPRSQPVERLVQVHDRDVQAVAVFAAPVGQAGQRVAVDLLAGQCAELGLPRRHPLGQRRVGPGIVEHRPGHQVQVVDQPAGQPGQAGQVQRPVLQRGIGGQVAKPGRLVARADIGGGYLAGQVDRCLVGRRCVRGRGLEHGKVELEPVIGLQRGVDAPGLQQRQLAQRGDCVLFFHGAVMLDAE